MDIQILRDAQPKENTLLEMAIVGYRSEVEKISAKIADIKAQLGQRGAKATATGTDQRPTEAPYDERSGPRHDRRRTESEMGGAETATGRTIGEAHEQALGGLQENKKGYSLSGVHAPFVESQFPVHTPLDFTFHVGSKWDPS
jgi:hypothetical protein